MLIRQATDLDAKAIQILLEQLGYSLNLEQVLGRIAAFNREQHQILLAEKDGVVIGCIAFACYEHLVFPGRCCNIETLIVEEHHRGTGAGTLLVKAAEAYANEKQCVTIELVSANHRIPSGTHAFYKNLGYRTHVDQDYTYFAKRNEALYDKIKHAKVSFSA